MSRREYSYSQPHGLANQAAIQWGYGACRSLTMTVSAAPTTSHQCLATKDVLEVLRISRATLYRLLAAGELPPPIKISFTKNAWLRSDIDTYLASRIAARGVLQ